MSGDPARETALELLAGVLDTQRTLIELKEAGLGADIPPPARARAETSARAVLRNLARLDSLLDGFLSRRPPAAARHVLRLMAAEILIDGTPPHAAVHSGVALMRARAATRRFAGLANAVGRRLADEGPALWPALPPDPLPAWIGGPVRKAAGRHVLAAVTGACRADPPTDLTPKDPATARALADSLGAELLPTGSLRLARRGQISALPGFDAGAWWVQDAAAAMPVRLLGPLAGRSVLDLCAAPGGKTLQLAAAGAHVTALDVSAPRLARVRQNLARTGLSAEIVTADARAWAPHRRWDCVLLDAPCSATGTLRRHPDLPFARPDPDLRPLLALQAALIDRALTWLNPGGTLLYCTCSLLPQEGPRQIARALERHPALARVDLAPLPAGIDDNWVTEAGDLILRPDYWAERGGMDGFFATCLTLR